MGRRLAALAALVTAIAVIGSQPVVASSSAEAEFVSRINAVRRAHGLRTLSVRSDLVSVARRHSGRMADDQTIYHNSNVWNEVDGWRNLAENVGRGRTVEGIHDGFMASSEHRYNIMWRDLNEVGVGVVTGSDGKMYVTQIFALRGSTGGGGGGGSPAQPTVSSGGPAPSVATPAAPVRAKPTPREPKPITVHMLAALVRLG